MLKIKSYVKVNSLAEAYELNQKKTARILGGMVWMKMGNRAISTAIDLSGLGLDAISENDDEFVIGCMTPLHDLETNEALNTYTHGAMKESLCHIVGVQFRNCATVGGSIYGRYGFSDVLTMFLGMDTWVELYDAGRIPLTEFVNMKKDNDILVNIIVRKEPLLTCYLSQRNIKTDFPVLTCAASVIGNEARTVIGARPARAMIVEDKKQILKNFRNMTKKQKEAALQAEAQITEQVEVVTQEVRITEQAEAVLQAEAQITEQVEAVLQAEAQTAEQAEAALQAEAQTAEQAEAALQAEAQTAEQAEALLQVEAQITEQVEAVQEAAVQAVQVHQTQLNQQLLVYQLIKMMGKNNNYGGTFA